MIWKITNVPLPLYEKALKANDSISVSIYNKQVNFIRNTHATENPVADFTFPLLYKHVRINFDGGDHYCFINFFHS